MITPNFRVIAQSLYGNQRIARFVRAASAEAALRSVAAELQNAGFYAVDAVLA